MTPRIRVRQLVKRFGAVTAVDRVSFDVAEGELLALLGPSGCGKTTTLRCIGGYDPPTEGTVELEGRRIDDLPVHRRDIGMVFQSYALFPHKTVADNVGFALKMRGVARVERRRRVEEALALVDLPGYEERYPAQLSGGQRQRVALARALIHRPAVLLLDEPLANLDRKLRQAMRVELKVIHQKVGISAVLVTHDQEEALVMADRIAVMERGRIHQIGTPSEIYHRPATSFVATFIGETNLLDGEVDRVENGLAWVGIGNGLSVVVETTEACRAGRPVSVSVRPERIDMATTAPPGTPNRISGVVEFVTYLGASASYRVHAAGGRRLHVTQPLAGDRATFADGDRVELWWPPDRGFVLD